MWPLGDFWGLGHCFFYALRTVPHFASGPVGVNSVLTVCQQCVNTCVNTPPAVSTPTVLTPIHLCQHLSLTQDFCVNVKTQSLLVSSPSVVPARCLRAVNTVDESSRVDTDCRSIKTYATRPLSAEPVSTKRVGPLGEAIFVGGFDPSVATPSRTGAEPRAMC